MRVLFTTQPGVGHLHPLLPVAAGLRGRGHDVLFAASASFAGEIGRAGFDAVAAGRSWLAVEMAKAFPEITSIPPGPERYAWARAAIFAGHTARRRRDRPRRRWPLVASRSGRSRGRRVRRVPGRRAARCPARRGAHGHRELVVQRPPPRRRAAVGTPGAPRAATRPGRGDAVPVPPAVLRPCRPGRTRRGGRAHLSSPPPGGAVGRRCLSALRHGWRRCRGAGRCTPRSAPSTTGATCSRRSSRAWPTQTSTSSSPSAPATTRRASAANPPTCASSGGSTSTISFPTATPSSPTAAAARCQRRWSPGFPSSASRSQPTNR